VRTVDYRGTPVAGVPVEIAIARTEWNADAGRLDREVVATATLTTGEDGRGQTTIQAPDRAGSYQVESHAMSGDRRVSHEQYIWVPGADEPTFESATRSLELIADKATYAPGDVARIAIRGDRPTVRVLLTKEARTLTWHAVREASGDGTFDVPIADDDVGDTWVHVLYLHEDRVHYAEHRLRVPPTNRVIQVELTADREVYRPGEPGLFSVRTLDAAGQPVAAQVAIGVVDEAVYGVKADTTPDGLRVFYRTEYSRVATDYSRQYYFVGYAGTQRMQLAARRRPLSLADFKADVPERPDVRKDFPDAIHWQPAVVTDADGRAEVQVTYPDSLTTWRLTARAVTEDTRLGAAVVRTTTTRDLLIRVVPPRFLTERDTVQLPTVAHNYVEGADVEATVEIEAAGVTPAVPLAPATARIARGGEARHAWTFRADMPGTATFTGRVTAGEQSDAMQVQVPVLPYGVRRDVGRAGVVAAGATASVSLDVPASSNPAARAIEVRLAPSLAGSILGAVDDLVAFPYGCTEQTVSSFVPNLLVLRTLAQLDLAPTERLSLLPRTTRDGVSRLLALQHENGAWGWWAADADHPFMTAYATFALLEAHAADVTVPDTALRRAVGATARYVRDEPRLVPELQAYLAYVLARAAAAGITHDVERVDDAALVETLWNRRGELSAYGQAWLVLVLHARDDDRRGELAATLANRAESQGDLAWWSTTGDPLLGDWGDAHVEATAAAVQAIAAVRPGDPLLDRAMRWLLVNRQRGAAWRSTKQTAMALYGLLAVLGERQQAPATVTVVVEANGASQTVTLTPADWTRPAPLVVTLPAQVGANDVRVRAEGGPAYWTATAVYHDTSESLERTGDRTLALSRKYASLVPVRKGTRVVYEERPFAGTMAPGDLVLVRVVVAGSDDWQFLMIEDPLPAGTEAVTDPQTLDLAQPPPWSFGSHREYRDDRVASFLQQFGGRAEFVYLLRATTPGQFRAMPARVTPMYVPDAMATSGTQSVDVVRPAATAGGQP